MRILYDDQIFSFMEFGGISKYFCELMDYYHSNNIPFDLGLKYSNNQHLKSLTFIKQKALCKNIKFPRKGLMIHFLNHPTMIKKLLKNEYDIFHPTYFNPYFLKYNGKKPFVLTVYDMIPEIFGDESYLGKLLIKNKKTLIYEADKVIAISENTKKDILKFHSLDEDKIEVIHIGIKKREVPISIDINIPEKFLLFIGNREGYKNFPFLIHSIAPILKERAGLFLVCAGSSHFSEAEIELFSRLKISDKILHYPADSAILPIFYKKALCFIFPSKYEGFGIPIIEAFSEGCPVILSNTSSFPEIAGSAGLYFNPDDQTSLKECVCGVLDDDKLSIKLKLDGLQKAKEFTSEIMAKKTLNIYYSII